MSVKRTYGKIEELFNDTTPHEFVSALAYYIATNEKDSTALVEELEQLVVMFKKPETPNLPQRQQSGVMPKVIPADFTTRKSLG